MNLTFREQQVLDGILVGRIHKEIANEIGITVRTVRAHASKLYKKFGVSSKSALICAKLQVDDTKWHVLVMEGQVRQPDHDCTPDCEHWKTPC